MPVIRTDRAARSKAAMQRLQGNGVREKKSNQSVSLCKRVTAIAVVLLAIPAAYLGYSRWNSSAYSEPVVYDIDSRASLSVAKEEPCLQFCEPLFPGEIVSRVLAKGERVKLQSGYSSRMQMPGIASVNAGDNGYSTEGITLTDFRKNHDECTEFLEGAIGQISTNQRYIDMKDGKFPEAFKGLEVGSYGYDENYREIRVALIKSMTKNYIKVQKMTSRLLSSIDGKDAKTILAKLLKVHKAMLADRKDILIGSLRKRPLIINHEDMTTDTSVISEFTATPDPRELHKLMNAYSQKLKEGMAQMKSCADFDPINFAAWAHNELVEIHPFGKGNGRMGRSVMNAILQKAGYPSVVFVSDKPYVQAIIKNKEEPGFFADFLRKELEKTQHLFSLNEPCYKGLTC